MSCGVDLGGGLDLKMLWLWCRLAATTPIGPPAWEPPYAVGAALEKTKRPKKKKKVKIIPLDSCMYLQLSLQNKHL